MRTCHIFRALLIGGLLFPLFGSPVSGQNVYTFVSSHEGDGSVSSNVPLNEINIHAFRHFRKRFPAVMDESWLKTAEGYIVSFQEQGHPCQAHFDRMGTFMYSVKYYSGKDATGDPALLVRIHYPGYRIDVVTEITDGEKTCYLVKIENSSSVKTLSIKDGKAEVTEELINAGATGNKSDRSQIVGNSGN
jgi:hypothetical protein